MTFVMERENDMKKFNRKLRSAQLEEEGRKRKKSRMLVLIIVLILILAAVLIALFNRKKDKTYNTYEVLHTEEISMDSSVRYISYDGGYIRYDRDGAQAYDAGGNQRWNISYELKNPIVSVCAPYTAIADKGSGEFYIVDNKGTVSKYELSEKIAEICTASQGVTAVMTTGSTEDHIYLYEPNSTKQLVDIKTVTKSNGFPVAMALSQDGRKLVTSYLSLDGDELQSWVTFYNFGEVGQNYVDNMVGSYSFAALIPEVAFVTNNIAMVCRDDGLVLYRMTEIPKVLLTEDFTSEIRSIFYSSDYTGLILKAEAGKTEDRLVLYHNEKARKVLDMPMSIEYSGIYTSGQDIVCFSGLDMTILNVAGKVKFQTSFTKNVKQIFRVDDNTKYLIIGDQMAETIQLKQKEKK